MAEYALTDKQRKRLEYAAGFIPVGVWGSIQIVTEDKMQKWHINYKDEISEVEIYLGFKEAE